MFLLSKTPTIANQFVAEMRDVNVQTDRMRFRRNMQRIGEVMAYELSKKLTYETVEVETPLGIANVALPTEQPVIASILRAGLPLHEGVLNVFDKADNAFVSAYRKHHKDGTFEIEVEYLSCPPLENRILIVADPMLATGASLYKSILQLLENGKPKEIHIITAIASADGVDFLRRMMPNAQLWIAALDEELTAKSYIVPGLGDAGDLAFGEKMQD